MCDKDLSINELTKAVEKMKSNKSPGSDGITIEFYQYFWKDVNELVLESFIYGFKHNILSSEQRRGILRLIPQKSKYLTRIKIGDQLVY